MVANDWAAVGDPAAWLSSAQKTFAAHTTPHMDSLIEVAHANGAIATKVCGTGGGGCIAFYCEEARKTDVEHALRGTTDAEVLDWKICSTGLTVNTSVLA